MCNYLSIQYINSSIDPLLSYELINLLLIYQYILCIGSYIKFNIISYYMARHEMSQRLY